ncbi:NADH-quinone oxidoreductase subunit 5 family protein [Phycicoccus elongatus]|uniref:NADH-quinone oxidoreductase subunit 5 family protein n=1 Tax=Phycicoccus elongatus TaxID=101689 RepID=UPI002BA10C34|nr:proton-conducting transporter membrane subunit [Phycicoccus elongatus]HPQ74227.1 proton-conducting transporter membrane subunit [Phycicoccus elongatus]
MSALLLIVVSAVIGVVVLLTRRWAVVARALAPAGSGFLALLAGGAMLRTQAPETISWLPSIDLGGLFLPLELGTSRPLAAIAFVVALVSAAVQIYSTWYLRDDDRYPVFAATVALFTAAMFLVVHSRDLALTLVGWEVMGWCSYLLIGHWSRKESARRAAHKAFLVTRLADVGFVLGVVGLATSVGSTGYAAVLRLWAEPTVCDAYGCVGPNPVLRNTFLVLIIVGVLGKSAQVPFQDWLPDAMEGPTPASALIHAATMVAAGTVVLAGLYPALAQAEVARWVLGIATSVTMVLAALLAMGQSDLKRLLAWSTVSQVAIMLSALAAAPVILEQQPGEPPAVGVPPGPALAIVPGAALFHLWSHALFKSLLFLAIGLLGVIAGGTTAALLRGAGMRTRLGRWAFLIGLLSLAGVPLVVGGFSKESVIDTAYQGASQGGPGLLVLLALLVTVVLTAAYSTRAYLVIAELIDVTAPVEAVGEMSESRRQRRSESLDPDGRGAANAVLVTLAVLTLIGGLALALDLFDLHGLSWVWTLITVLLIGVGAGLAFALGRAGDPGVRFAGRRAALFDGGFGADTAYRALAKPVVHLARIVAFVDTEVIDGYVRGAAVTARLGGAVTERAHRAERLRTGGWLVVLGLVAVLAVGVFAWR